MAKRTGIMPPKGRTGYRKVAQTKAGGTWFPRYAMAATPSGNSEKAFRHVWSKRGDRRLYIFRFRITRDDGTVIDETMLSYMTGIIIRQKHRETEEPQWIGEAHGRSPEYYPEDMPYWEKEEDIWHYKRWGSKFEYDTKTQIWTVYLFNTETVKSRRGKVFWVTFLCDDGVTAMYLKPSEPGGGSRYIYKEDDFYGKDDCIRPKFYEVRVPYYKETYTSERVESTEFPDDGSYGMPCAYPGVLSYGRCSESKEQALIVTVESSIPYTVHYLTSGVGRAFYYGTYISYGPTRTLEDYLIQAYAHWYHSDWYEPDGSRYTPGADYATPAAGYPNRIMIPSWVTVTTTKGDSSSNIVTNPIDSEEIVTPPPYTVQTTAHRMDAVYTGDDPFDLPRPCSDCPGNVAVLTFRIFRLKYRIRARLNTD